MIAESVYSRKFALLEPFSEEIFTGIKKEIKREIAAKGSLLQRKMGVQTLKDTKEMSELLFKNITNPEEEELGEWVASAWINRHGDMFECYHNHLVKISANYDQLTELPAATEGALALDSIEKFSALNTYIFSVLNSVVFSSKKMEELRALAQKQVQNKQEKQEKVPEVSLEEMKKFFEDQMQKMAEKQEKKILGITERYRMEIAGYRKQIGQLQKKIEDLIAKSR